MSNCGKKNEIENSDFYLRQIFTSCLSHYSYYIESEKKAIVIDPLRESDLYDQLLSSRNANLDYILETHFHADFVSGHYELANKYNSTIIFGPNAKADNVKVAEDGEIISIGKIKIKVIHTPGHTLESSCFLLIDSTSKPICLFTGDTIFLGEVGRPDLAVKEDVTEYDLAGMLYDSIHQKIITLDDDITIYPAHGAGSACGKNIIVGDYDTLGNQKIVNYAFNQNLKKEEFIEILTSNLNTPPKYFFYDVMLNRKGYQFMNDILNKYLKAIKLEEFKKISTENDVVIIDTRDVEVAANGFIPGSKIISLKMTFAIWSATLYTPNNKFLIVSDIGKERESIIRLARVGLENVVGYLEGGYETWAKSNENISKFSNFDLLNDSYENFTILDVREKNEWAKTGVIHGSKLISLSELSSKINDIPKSDNILIVCQSGNRSALAISILKSIFSDSLFFNGRGGIKLLIDNNSDKLEKLLDN